MSVAPSLRKINFFSLSFSVPICCCKYKLSVDLLTHCEFWSLKKTKCDNKKVLQFSVWSCLTPIPIFLRNLLWLTTMLYLGQTKFFLEKNYCMLCALDIISCVDIIFIYINALGVSYSCHYFDVYSWCYNKNNISLLCLYSKDAYLL